MLFTVVNPKKGSILENPIANWNKNCSIRKPQKHQLKKNHRLKNNPKAN
jgi:hypothetical protein